MRLDHLLSKEEVVRAVVYCSVTEVTKKVSGGDALRGHTRSHPEHDG